MHCITTIRNEEKRRTTTQTGTSHARMSFFPTQVLLAREESLMQPYCLVKECCKCRSNLFEGRKPSAWGGKMYDLMPELLVSAGGGRSNATAPAQVELSLACCFPDIHHHHHHHYHRRRIKRRQEQRPMSMRFGLHVDSIRKLTAQDRGDASGDETAQVPAPGVG